MAVYNEDLFQFWFLNYDDTYYCKGFLQLDHKRFILLKLIERGYNYVYFVSEDGENVPAVTCCTRAANAVKYDARSEKPAKISKEFCSWLYDCLNNKHGRSAVVFDLGEFVKLFSPPERKKLLQAKIAELIKNCSGTIILKTPPELEKYHSFLISNDILVFSKNRKETVVADAHINNIRSSGNDINDMYFQLHNDKGDSFVFFNTYTYARIKCLLEHLVLEYPKRTLPESEMFLITGFLTDYLNDIHIQMKYLVFDMRSRYPGPLYRELFKELSDSIVWNKLIKAAKAFLNDSEEGSPVRKYPEGEFPKPGYTSKVGVVFPKDDYRSKCLGLMPREDLDKRHSFSGVRSDRMIELLRGMIVKVTPKEEDPTVKQKIGSLIVILQQAENDSCCETYIRALYCVFYCIRMICNGFEKEQNDTIDNYISLAKRIDEYRKQVNISRFNDPSSGFAGHLYEQNDEVLAVNYQMLRKMDELFKNNMLTTNTLDINKLKNDLRIFENALKVPPEASANDTEEEPPEAAPKEISPRAPKRYTCTEEDLKF